MTFKPISITLITVLTCQLAVAQYGTPESLKAEMGQGDDLVFAKEATELAAGSALANAVFMPGKKTGAKLPALVILPTCGGISQHIRVWTEEALQRGYVVLPMDGLRGLKADCGSPSRISNGRLVKDTLDAVAHLAALPDVDRQRISVLGFSKAAIVQPDTDRPFLALLGGRDNETPPATCLELLPKLKEKGLPVQWHLYPEATHAWDKKEQDGFSKLDFKNERVTYQYSATVTEDSMRRAFEFLAQPVSK